MGILMTKQDYEYKFENSDLFATPRFSDHPRLVSDIITPSNLAKRSPQALGFIMYPMQFNVMDRNSMQCNEILCQVL